MAFFAIIVLAMYFINVFSDLKGWKALIGYFYIPKIECNH